MAQDVLARAVVYAQERGGTWSTIAEALNSTEQQAREQYAPTLDGGRTPWTGRGSAPAGSWPAGCRTAPNEPDATATDLDQWCLRRLDEHSGTRHNARHDGIEDRMVSANLPEQTPVTEMTSLTRTAGLPHRTRHKGHSSRVRRLPGTQSPGNGHAARRRGDAVTSHNIATTAAQTTPDAQRQLQQISDLVDAYAALAAPTGNADLMIPLFQIRLVLGDDPAQAGRRISSGRMPPN